MNLRETSFTISIGQCPYRRHDTLSAKKVPSVVAMPNADKPTGEFVYCSLDILYELGLDSATHPHTL